MVEYFETHDLNAAAISAGTAPARRDELIRSLQAGRLCCLFTVDVFNEGVDIPCVDTVLFLRPTESATVFIQQLGRGLRLHPSKSCLTVLDFVAKGHPRFRFDARYCSVIARLKRTIPPSVEIWLVPAV